MVHFATHTTSPLNYPPDEPRADLGPAQVPPAPLPALCRTLPPCARGGRPGYQRVRNRSQTCATGRSRLPAVHSTRQYYCLNTMVYELAADCVPGQVRRRTRRGWPNRPRPLSASVAPLPAGRAKTPGRGPGVIRSNPKDDARGRSRADLSTSAPGGGEGPAGPV